MPLPSAAAADVEGRIEIRPDLAPGRATSTGSRTFTPVLDIKRYVPAFDVADADRTGWLAHGAPRVHEIRSDWR